MKDNPLDSDSPIWTADDFAASRPASQVLPPHLARLLVRQPAGELSTGVANQRGLARGFRLAA